MNIVSRAPFRILGAHGVARAHVLTLERQFGPLFPGNITGPDDALMWTLTALPWDRMVEPLRAWVTRGQTKGQITDDNRARRAMTHLELTPNHDKTLASLHEMQDLLQTLGRVRGVDDASTKGYNVDDARLNDEFRSWVATYGAVAAAHCTTCEKNEYSSEFAVATTAHTAFTWVISQHAVALRELAIDRCLQDIVGALAAFVGTWVKGGDA